MMVVKPARYTVSEGMVLVRWETTSAPYVLLSQLPLKNFTKVLYRLPLAQSVWPQFRSKIKRKSPNAFDSGFSTPPAG